MKFQKIKERRTTAPEMIGVLHRVTLSLTNQNKATGDKKKNQVLPFFRIDQSPHAVEVEVGRGDDTTVALHCGDARLTCPLNLDVHLSFKAVRTLKKAMGNQVRSRIHHITCLS